MRGSNGRPLMADEEVDGLPLVGLKLGDLERADVIHARQVLLPVHVGPLLEVATKGIMRLFNARYPSNAQAMPAFRDSDDVGVAEEVDVFGNEASVVQVSQEV